MRETSDRVEQVYRVEALKMWRALVGYSGDREIANDAVSEAFARALANADNIRDIGAWTWKVAFRLTNAELRRRREPGDRTGTEDELRVDADVPELVRALRRLPSKQRLAIVLHDYADRPTLEVAELLGCSRATVHVHLSQGRRRLRQFLEVIDA